MSYYTGIGSRETPEEMLKKFRYLGRKLAQGGFILRSGGADGADTAFEDGCTSVAGAKDIYLPWSGFNGRVVPFFVPPSKESYELASTLHPYWDKLKQGAQKLHARNTYQVLGEKLDTPSQFTICYTRDGAETLEAITSKTGGTATAIKLSLLKGVPVFNFKNEASVERFKAFMRDKWPGVLPE